MNLPSLPLDLFVLVPSLFIVISVFTKFRYELRPNHYIEHITTYASLVLGFIFLYAMQKYDKMDANVPVVERNIIGLQEKALQYKPELLCLLVDYLVNFLNFDNDKFPIINFETQIIPLLETEEEIFRLREAVTTLENISNERISRTNLVVEPIWYLVFFILLLLTLFFPMDISFEKSVDSVLVILLIWVPLFTIYYLYTYELNKLQRTMENLIDELNKKIKKEGIKCKKN